MQSGSLDESLLIRDNSMSSNIVKPAEKLGEELLVTKPTVTVTTDIAEDWSPAPLQLSSFNLTKPPPLKPKPTLRTETLERHPVRPSLRTFTSGRCSAEPLDSYKLTSMTGVARLRSQIDTGMLVTPLPTSLSELDLRYRVGHGNENHYTWRKMRLIILLHNRVACRTHQKCIIKKSLNQ